MKIVKNSPCIFVRLIDYKGNDFAKEHFDVFKKNKKVWLLKMGKTVKDNFVSEVIENNGVMITKSTARNGNQFYICKIEKVDDMEEYIYPEYYNDIFYDMSIDAREIKKYGYWFKIVDMKPVDQKIVDKFETISTGRSLLECGLKFNQVSQIHAISKEDLSI